MTQTCENCLFNDFLEAEISNASSRFRCRRFPPSFYVVEATRIDFSIFPPVRLDDWCGEWKPKEGN